MSKIVGPGFGIRTYCKQYRSQHCVLASPRPWVPRRSSPVCQTWSSDTTYRRIGVRLMSLIIVETEGKNNAQISTVCRTPQYSPSMTPKTVCISHINDSWIQRKTGNDTTAGVESITRSYFWLPTACSRSADDKHWSSMHTCNWTQALVNEKHSMTPTCSFCNRLQDSLQSLF